MTEREKLYKKDRNGYVTIKVKFNPMLLSILGYYNVLKKEDKPDLEEVAKVQRELNHYL